MRASNTRTGSRPRSRAPRLGRSVVWESCAGASWCEVGGYVGGDGGGGGGDGK